MDKDNLQTDTPTETQTPLAEQGTATDSEHPVADHETTAQATDYAAPAEATKHEAPAQAAEQASAEQATAPQEATAADPASLRPKPLVSWDAQEYVVRDKNGGWYAGLVIIGLLLIAGSILLQWWTFAVLILVSVIALIVYSVRPPRMIHYELTSEGLREGTREYKYADYKAFGVMHEGAHFSIVLVPRKRFSSKVTIYFPEANGEAIVDQFGAHLPMEEVKQDILDRVVKFLRI